MKVLLTKDFLPGDLDYISMRLLPGIELVSPRSYDDLSLRELAPEADVLLGGYVSEILLSYATKLKFIQIPWTGIDNLDFELLGKHNITVCNSHSNAGVVAEHAVAMMFDAAKKITYHDKLLRQGKWNRVNPGRSNEISPFSSMVSKSKVGVVGFGAIGRKIFEFLKGFDCIFKVFNKEEVMFRKEMCNLTVFPTSAIHSELNDLDYVFVAVPLTPSTRKMINKDFLSSMNREAVLINISRGEVVNEKDLYDAVYTKSIAFAAIDTWFNYPTHDMPEVFPSADFDFHLLDNIVLSPHRAGYMKAGFPHLDDAIENLNRFYQGKSLINVVSLIERY